MTNFSMIAAIFIGFAATVTSPSPAVVEQLTQRQHAVLRVLRQHNLNDVDDRALNPRQLRLIQSQFGNTSHSPATMRIAVERIIQAEDFETSGRAVSPQVLIRIRRDQDAADFGTVDVNRLTRTQVIEIRKIFDDRSSTSNQYGLVGAALARGGWCLSEVRDPARARFIRQSFQGTALASFDVDSLSVEQQRFAAVHLRSDTFNGRRMPKIIHYLQQQGLLAVR